MTTTLKESRVIPCKGHLNVIPFQSTVDIRDMAGKILDKFYPVLSGKEITDILNDEDTPTSCVDSLCVEFGHLV